MEKVIIGVLAAAVVAGGGYGIYQAVQADPTPASVTDPTEDITTIEAPTTTEAETTTKEDITEASMEAPTDAPTAAPTATPTTTKATTTTETTTAKPTTTKKASEPDKIYLIGMPVVWSEKNGEYSCYCDFVFALNPGELAVPNKTRWVGEDGTKLAAGEDMAGQQKGTLYWIG